MAAARGDGVEMTLQTMRERLIKSYSAYFDIEHDAKLPGEGCSLLAHYTSRSEKYVLVKRAQLWAIECEEYLCVFEEETLTAARLERILHAVEAAEPQLVRPRPDHMYTYLSVVVLAEAAEPEALALLRRHRFRRSYKLTVHGWCNLRAAVVDLGADKVYTNRDGRDMKAHLSELLHPRPPKARRKTLFGIKARQENTPPPGV